MSDMSGEVIGENQPRESTRSMAHRHDRIRSALRQLLSAGGGDGVVPRIAAGGRGLPARVSQPFFWSRSSAGKASPLRRERVVVSRYDVLDDGVAVMRSSVSVCRMSRSSVPLRTSLLSSPRIALPSTSR
jgi:hypothetical protein